ncbi:MAG TPA: tyrosine-type recombinase/integrase [Myxococcota bacterium]|nr:tyrosine-type recombinase/integrase [Myxococcota bacterium]
MTRKPKGAKYRNLTLRGGVIYYERWVAGKRIRHSAKTSDWLEAASFRDALEARDKIGLARVPFLAGEVPRFAEFVPRYLAEGTGHLAPTTRHDRYSYLSETGPLLSFFGTLRLDAITTPMLHNWWHLHVVSAGRKTGTGKHYVDVLSDILGFAKERGIIEANPVKDFREDLKRRTRTARGRADATPGQNIRPIGTAAELERLTESARTEGAIPSAFVLTLLDAGLRVGEVLGLKWGAIRWGEDENDPTRALVIDCSRPRGGAEGLTKSGRERVVALSRRLRECLWGLYVVRGLRFNPAPEALVFPGLKPRDFYRTEWRRICARAGLGHRMLKDLRDTYASHLLSAGVQLGYVSKQLGHSNVAVTAQHYAKWAGGDLYRSSMQLEPGEVPADFLARLKRAEVPSVPLTRWSGVEQNRGVSGRRLSPRGWSAPSQSPPVPHRCVRGARRHP